MPHDAPSPRAELRLLDLGRTPYAAALERQRSLHAARKAGTIPDTLLLTEHEPVLTTGQGADFRHVLAAPEEIARQGIALVKVERGGDVTYHGPGQLVAYPILDLRRQGRDVHLYVRRLEETALRFLATYGIAGERRAGAPGVYVAEMKIASVGIFVSSWVTMHGLAINLEPEPAHLALLRPCGLADTSLTSIALLTGRAPGYQEAAKCYATVFTETFGYRM